MQAEILAEMSECSLQTYRSAWSIEYSRICPSWSFRVVNAWTHHPISNVRSKLEPETRNRGRLKHLEDHYLHPNQHSTALEPLRWNSNRASSRPLFSQMQAHPVG